MTRLVSLVALPLIVAIALLMQPGTERPLDAARAQDAEHEHHHAPSADRAVRDRLNAGMLALESGGALKPLQGLPWAPRAELPATVPPGDTAWSDPDLYERVADATVLLHRGYKCGRCDNWHGGVVTGAIIHPNGWVLTAAHVLDDAEPGQHMAAMTRDGRTFSVVAIGFIDEASDAALVKIDASDLPHLPLAAGDPRVGEPIRVISHPQGHFHVLTDGLVSRLLGEDEAAHRRLQITAGFATGSSGAPVVDGRGNIVGIAISTETLYADEEEHDNPQLVLRNCTPVSEIRRALADAVNP
jgi:S1-C subfamily serine protease